MTPALNLPNVDVSMAARQYVSAGWVLVPIAKGSKGPRHTGWNLLPQCIDDEKRAGKLRGGIGLAHAYSRTACVDLDDLEKCRAWLFDEHVIDLDGLLEAPDAVQILSGRPNRGKLLYRLPDGIDPLVTVKVPDCGLELRCATRDGKTVQDVLPPTIHPDTLLPYQWAGAGDWHALPVLPAEILDIWTALAAKVDPARPPSGVPEGDPEDDPVVAHLEVKGLVRLKLRDGTRHIACPFEADHTTKGTVGDCSYFPALTGGYAQGHFHCLHTHCAERSDDEFLEAIGFDRHAVVSQEFDVVVGEGGEEPRKRPGYVRHPKTGEILVTMDNMTKGVADPAECGMRVAYDSFKDEIVFSHDEGENWVPFKDADYVRVRINLERRGFKSPNREITRDAVMLVAEKNKFDSAQLWLNRLEWDGVRRIERFFPTYFDTADTPYTRAVGRYLWSALAGRVLVPGIKADMAPVAVGDQGAGKSTGVAAIVPDPMFFAEISFGEKEDDLSRKMRGRLIAELGELRGLHTKEMESIKAWITKQHEDWTPKYREFNTQFPRRLVFFGTTNKHEFLADETGNRRWLPVKVGQVDHEAIARDRLQLWAEGRHHFIEHGIDYKDAEKLALAVHSDHMMREAWEPVIDAWMSEPDTLTGDRPCERAFISTHEILTNALKIEARNFSRLDEMRASNAMRALGWEPVRKTVNGKRQRGYCPTCPTEAIPF